MKCVGWSIVKCKGSTHKSVRRIWRRCFGLPDHSLAELEKEGTRLVKNISIPVHFKQTQLSQKIAFAFCFADHWPQSPTHNSSLFLYLFDTSLLSEWSIFQEWNGLHMVDYCVKEQYQQGVAVRKYQMILILWYKLYNINITLSLVHSWVGSVVSNQNFHLIGKNLASVNINAPESRRAYSDLIL